MRRLLVPAALLLTLHAPAAEAAPPMIAAAAAPAVGAAPLTTTLTAMGDASSYRWELPGGATTAGPTLTTTFPAGLHAVTLVGSSAAGEETRATVNITSVALSVTAPAEAAYRTRIRLRGRIVPALAGSKLAVHHRGRQVTTGVIRPDGSFRIGVRPRAAGAYTVRFASVVSAPVTVTVRPRLHLETRGAPVVGGALEAVAALQPAGAGTVTLRAYRRGRLVNGVAHAGTARLTLPTRSAGAYRVVASLAPRPGYVGRRALLDAIVRQPALALGSRGAGVVELERRLSSLSLALQQVDGYFGRDTYEAVLAFQKLHGLSRTGRVDARLWQQLAAARTPQARYGGDHIEVDKARQLLMLVRDGRVVLVSHVSTGATGNTPVGRWRVYRKVGGWDWVLWYPMYFLRGFAIHGYPEVPAYPASHGCVRVPMWLAPRLFAAHGYGTTIIVY